MQYKLSLRIFILDVNIILILKHPYLKMIKLWHPIEPFTLPPLPI